MPAKLKDHCKDTHREDWPEALQNQFNAKWKEGKKWVDSPGTDYAIEWAWEAGRMDILKHLDKPMAALREFVEKNDAAEA